MGTRIVQALRHAALAACALLLSCSFEERDLESQEAPPGAGGSATSATDPASSASASGGDTLNPRAPGAGGTTGDETGSEAMEPVAMDDLVAIEIAAAGSGAFGVIRSEPSGLDCSAPPCRAEFPRGTTVTLTAWTNASSGSGFGGWSAPCEGLGNCVVTLGSADVALVATYERANRAFVTSATTSGAIGGVAGADAMCSAAARDAGLGGTFRAWISAPGVDAIDRFSGSRGWVRVDGQALFDLVSDIPEGRMFSPLRVDEASRTVSDSYRVWTGTDRSGRLADSHCAGWTNATTEQGWLGAPHLQGLGFTESGFVTCTAQRGLYCMEAGKTLRVAPPPVRGRLAFPTFEAFLVGGGIAAADAHCQAEASAAGRTESFKAVLATTTASAASRFDFSGPPWVRADGTPIAPTAAGFFEAEQWLTSPNITLSGIHLTLNSMLAGGTSLLLPGTPDNTCNDWTSLTGVAPTGYSGGGNPRVYFTGLNASCSSERRFLLSCLEE